ncbi:MAG: glucosaminidase domain-containing protein [Saprospiraceae bacterium]|nr:glucosaminidase domain-containing protein [Saprospiraceae bacterium]
MRLLHILSVCALFLLPKAASANAIPVHDQQLFIDTWARMAVEQMGLYGVPASITLAQAIVESGWGQGRVALLGNNYFCIKANNGWAGPVIQAMDDDSLENKPIDSKFRRYGTIEESFADHSKFLRENPRYSGLFKLSPTDYRGWCYGLKSCGYATKGDYAEQLISTIERNGLFLYDKAVPEDQIKALGLPFEDLDYMEAVEAVEPAGDFIAIAPQVPQRAQLPQAPQTPAETAPIVALNEVNEETLLKVPGYRLPREQRPMAVAPPVVEIPVAQSFVKIPLILPKAAPKFERR